MIIQHQKRIREIVTVFSRLGFDYFIRKAKLSRFVHLPQRLFPRRKEEDFPVRLRKAFEELGASFIKLGQILSLRPDLIPPEYIREFERLQDEVPSFPYSEVRRIIKEEFGHEIEELFSKFKEEPIASASLSQVHLAELKNGKKVAVKVQRPDIEKRMREDIEIIIYLAKWLSHRFSFVKDYHLLDILDEFKRWSYQELNFRHEALYMEIISRNLKGEKSAIIPKVYDQLTSKKVLTSDFIEAYPLHEIEKIKDKKDIEKIIEKCYLIVSEMVFRDGVFHADPHPGNILVTKDNKIVFVDFGIVGRFDEELREKLLQLFLSLAKRDNLAAINHFLNLGKLEEPEEERDFKRELVDLVEPFRFQTLRDIEGAHLMKEFLELARKYRFIIPSDLVLYAKTLMTLEGIGLRYNPDYRLRFSQSFIKKLEKKEFSLSKISQRIKEKIKLYQKLGEDLPYYSLEAVKRISRGEVKMEIEHKELNEMRTEIERGSGNIAVGFVTAALIVAGAMLIEVPFLQIFNISLLSLISFLLAAFLFFWLIKRALFAKY